MSTNQSKSAEKVAIVIFFVIFGISLLILGTPLTFAAVGTWVLRVYAGLLILVVVAGILTFFVSQLRIDGPPAGKRSRTKK